MRFLHKPDLRSASYWPRWISWAVSLLQLLYAVIVGMVFYPLGDRLAGHLAEALFRRLLGVFLSLMAVCLVLRAALST
jgi:uncharacterized membrane protein YfcA